MNGLLEKINYYAILVEFQFRGSPNVHCLLWEANASRLTEG